MSNKPETDELLAYLAQLIESTSKGSLNWAEANPTTYTWQSNTPGRVGKLAIQAVQRKNQYGSKDWYFVFTVAEPTTGVQKLAVDGGTDAEVNKKLQELFKAIASSITRKGLDFLKRILPDK
jgi:hypothetical protein